MKVAAQLFTATLASTSTALFAAPANREARTSYLCAVVDPQGTIVAGFRFGDLGSSHRYTHFLRVPKPDGYEVFSAGCGYEDAENQANGIACYFTHQYATFDRPGGEINASSIYITGNTRFHTGLDRIKLLYPEAGEEAYGYSLHCERR